MGRQFFVRSVRRRVVVALAAMLTVSSTAAVVAVTTSVAAAPSAAAVAHHGAVAYVTRNDGRITRIDTATAHKIGGPVGAELDAASIAVTPNGSTAYFAMPGESRVGTLDTATNTISNVDAYPDGGFPDDIAVSPDGSKVYVADTDAEAIEVIDTSDNSVSSIEIDDFVVAIAVSPDGKTLWALDDGEGSDIARIDISGATPSIDYLGLDGSPTAIAITPDGSAVYVSTQYPDQIIHVATADNSMSTTSLPDNSGVSALAITPDGATVYAVLANISKVVPLATATDTLGNEIEVGGFPDVAAVTPDGSALYVGVESNVSERPASGVHPFDDTTTSMETTTSPEPEISGRVVVVDTATNTATHTIQIAGTSPFGIAITPDPAPVARLAVAPGPVGQPSDFDASASTSSPTRITNYAWDFGDGNTTDTSTPTVQHAYASTGDYTATVTVTDAAGTSTAQVFTGHTMLRDGGPSATTARTITVVTCDANDPCSGNVSEGNQNVGVSGTSSTPATLSITIGVATVSCGDGDTAKPREVVGLDPEDFSASNLQVQFTFIGQNTLKKIPICYSSTKPFRTFGGKFVTTGLVPHCHTDPPESLPCLASVALQGDNEVETVFVPATDPKFWAKQKVQVG